MTSASLGPQCRMDRICAGGRATASSMGKRGHGRRRLHHSGRQEPRREATSRIMAILIMVSAPPRSVRSRGQGAAIHRLRRDGGRGGLAQRPLLITAEYQRGQLLAAGLGEHEDQPGPRSSAKNTTPAVSPSYRIAVQARARVNMGRLIARRCEPINLFCFRNGRAVRRRSARRTAALRAWSKNGADRAA